VILTGDCRAILPTLDAGSVRCVVTSPPYFGLRDYGTATWEGGSAECGHTITLAPRSERAPNGLTGGTATVDAGTVRRGDCSCGARRIDAQLGLERTPEEYVAAMVGVFREVVRAPAQRGTDLSTSCPSGVLRKDCMTARYPASGEAGFLYVYAGTKSRADTPSIAELLAAGWTIEHTNRWGGALMKLEVRDGRNRMSPRRCFSVVERRDRRRAVLVRPRRGADHLGLAGIVALIAALATVASLGVLATAWGGLLANSRMELVGVEE
jgi:hypothetical protein